MDIGAVISVVGDVIGEGDIPQAYADFRLVEGLKPQLAAAGNSLPKLLAALIKSKQLKPTVDAITRLAVLIDKLEDSPKKQADVEALLVSIA